MRYLFSILFIGLIVPAFSQQTSQYTLYMMNKFGFNPGYAGLDHSLSVTAGYRGQWVGFGGFPNDGINRNGTLQNQFVNVHMPLYFARGGIGIQLENAESGPERHLYVGGAYNYQLYLGGGILSIGVGGGIVQNNFDGSILRTPDGSYENNTIINHEDGILPTLAVSGMAPTFRAGVYFQSDKVEFGLASTHLSEPIIELEQISFQFRRNYFFNAGLNLEVGRSLTFHPSLLVRSDGDAIQTDLSAIFKYNENLFVGSGFRGYNSNTIDAVSLIVGFKLSEKINLGYAYDFTLSNLNLASNGSHEILFNYNLNKRIGAGRPPRIIYNPRNL